MTESDIFVFVYALQFVRIKRHVSCLSSSNSSQRVRHEDTRRRCSLSRDLLCVRHVSLSSCSRWSLRHRQWKSSLWKWLRQSCPYEPSASSAAHFIRDIVRITTKTQTAQCHHSLKCLHVLNLSQSDT